MLRTAIVGALLCATASVATPRACAASGFAAGKLWNAIGRVHGFGWSDGYHVCCPAAPPTGVRSRLPSLAKEVPAESPGLMQPQLPQPPADEPAPEHAIVAPAVPSPPVATVVPGSRSDKFALAAPWQWSNPLQPEVHRSATLAHDLMLDTAPAPSTPERIDLSFVHSTSIAAVPQAVSGEAVPRAVFTGRISERTDTRPAAATRVGEPSRTFSTDQR